MKIRAGFFHSFGCNLLVIGKANDFQTQVMQSC
jgi:hypothetical protein